MNMTKRDRYIILAIVALGVVGAYWFLALAPKRDRLSKLDKDLASAKQAQRSIPARGNDSLR